MPLVAQCNAGQVRDGLSGIELVLDAFTEGIRQLGGRPGSGRRNLNRCQLVTQPDTGHHIFSSKKSESIFFNSNTFITETPTP